MICSEAPFRKQTAVMTVCAQQSAEYITGICFIFPAFYDATVEYDHGVCGDDDPVFIFSCLAAACIFAAR